MSKPIARYSVTFGLAGCYMPDYQGGPVAAERRKDLADIIRGELAMLDLPASLIREVKLTRLWRFIRQNGSSVAHFHIYHGANVLSFHGLTEAEYREQSEANDS